MFAVGQEALGIFALGQMATGVVAVGQLARGVVAVGQGAVGVLAIGQGALGVAWGAAMLGVGGRGFGGVLRVFPKLHLDRFRAPSLPPIVPLADLQAGRVQDGWVLERLEETELRVDGVALQLTPEAVASLREGAAQGHTHACVRVEVEERALPAEGGYRAASPRERVLVGRRMTTWLERSPRLRLEGPLTHPAGLFLRASGMIALATAWWILAGADIVAMFR